MQTVDVTAGGLFGVCGGQGLLAGARLAAGAGAPATLVLREGGAAGRILASLGAAAGEADELRPWAPLDYTGSVHVTVGGAGAQANLFIG